MNAPALDFAAALDRVASGMPEHARNAIVSVALDGWRYWRGGRVESAYRPLAVGALPSAAAIARDERREGESGRRHVDRRRRREPLRPIVEGGPGDAHVRPATHAFWDIPVADLVVAMGKRARTVSEATAIARGIIGEQLAIELVCAADLRRAIERGADGAYRVAA